jgi:hypothetical protein
VCFIDAAHFVFGTFLGCLWSLTRTFVKAASGRKRFNVPDVLDRVPTTHAEKLASLMTLNFQEFEDASFLAA